MAKKRPLPAPATRKRDRARTTRGASERSARRRVCILTGGGDAPGLNAVLRAFVRACTDVDIEVWGSEDGFEGLVQPNRLVRLNRKSVRDILPKGGSILGCSNRANPWAYPVRDARGRERLTDVSAIVIARLREHAIDTTVLVGGDGTMNFARRLSRRGVRVIGIPKTIDNDLAATDVTFGFDTALDTATCAIDTLHTTAEAHDRVMIVEVMGRHAGWIAMCAGIAGGAHVVLIPEIPYDIERVVAKVRERAARGATFSIIVVGEGARPRGGRLSTVARGRRGHLARLGGAGEALAHHLTGRIGHEIRVTVLGHLQRGGSPSAFDRLLGTRFGVAAARLCHAGQAGRMIALRGEAIVTVPLASAVAAPKLVPPHGELVDVARRVNIELGG